MSWNCTYLFFWIGPIPSRASIWCLKHKQHPREDYYCTCALILTYLRGCQRSLPHSFQGTNHGPAVQKAHRFSPPCIGTGYLCRKIMMHKAVRSSIAQTSVSVTCTFLPRNAVLATARSDFQRPADWSGGCQRLPGQSLAVCQNLVPLVNIKIAGKWMFIPLKMVFIGIDP